MVDLARQGLTTASVGKGGWVDEAAKGGNTRAQCVVWISGGPYAERRVACSCIDGAR